MKTLTTCHVSSKEHTCGVCDNKIPPGDKYWRHTEYECETHMVIYNEHTNCELYNEEK